MRTIAGIFLMLVSIFSGGCSLISLTLGAGSGGFGSVIVSGFVLAGLSGYVAVKLLHPDPPNQEAPTFPLSPQNQPKPPDDPDMWR